ncbi:glycosyltransferase family 2 protein [Marinovum sp.]|uniref:glycosyltransferase family 2 protein n=1 Tax=Marinovum sp. TaxID=2024839 RepID=UPI002B27223D|nr:glycosyltransferase family 2 protein [Marinovum sp.]
MKISLHIGPDLWATTRLQQVLAAKRRQLLRSGVLFARSPGAQNHTRLFMAVTDPGAVDTLRHNRGFAAPERQAQLRADVTEALAREVETSGADHLILSAHQFGTTLLARSELERLKALLAPISTRIEVIAHVDGPARMLLRHYIVQVLDGRMRPLDLELRLAGRADWWAACLADRPEARPDRGLYPEVQMAPAWLDYAGLRRHWQGVFGAGCFGFRPLDVDALCRAEVTEELRASFDLDPQIGKHEEIRPPAMPSAEWIARARQFNDMLTRLLARGDHAVSRQVWKRLLGELRTPGPTMQPGTLAPIAERFAGTLATLAQETPALAPVLAADPPLPRWQEAETTEGFRASQYLAAALPRIEKSTRELRAAEKAQKGEVAGLTKQAEAVLPDLAKEKFAQLRGGPFAPHNRLGLVNEEELAAAFAPAPRRPLPPGSSGTVIVGCMKNEAPYILEWIAYHRAIGVDSFLIYTNGCEDGTDEILARLQALGVIEHRNNDDWSGKSPQQYALNRSLKEPVIVNSDWIIHIDVDEFINIRCGNGTLDDFRDRVPEATNVAMTWRLFGHNGVTRLDDSFVIEQFDACAPKFCPKPHTAWGFKTMVRNIGAYTKLSCHRPNKLVPGMETRVHWVNGSGQPMGDEVKVNGWRNSKRSIGYDLLQLNHYALRSAESFLIKRQRGRALHVDRSIGLNYWIRMDWNDHRDITIKRNVPRVRAEFDRLLADPELAACHARGRNWHRAKAQELRNIPEFAELYEQAMTLRLTGTERAAYALALDMET